MKKTNYFKSSKAISLAPRNPVVIAIIARRAPQGSGAHRQSKGGQRRSQRVALKSGTMDSD